jgi:GT2 family glycosyltransferase
MSFDKLGTLTADDAALDPGQEAEADLIAGLFLRFEARYLEDYQDALETLHHAAPEAARWRSECKQAQYALQLARQQLHATTQVHQQLIQSRSWRYTKPLRALGRLLSGDLETFSEGFWNQLKPLADVLPRQRVLPRDKLLFALIEVSQPLLKSSPAYRKWRAAYFSSPIPQGSARLVAREELASTISGLHFEATTNPLVSVIIPSYGNLPYTLTALRSLASFPPAAGLEVIVAEDASGDQEMIALRDVKGLIYLENEKNLGFLRSCNQAAGHATGKYIFFLNSDAQVTLHALDRLLEVFAKYPNAGIAGSMLIYPDGRLQEAGAIVWRDGSGMNVGRMENPENSEFNYLRETDYCSAAAILIERELFFKVGCFDERYAPAYYEDTDLAFKVRAAGRQVLFQPTSLVIHHEGLSHGTDVAGGLKANQLVNREKFRQRWAEVLDRENFEPATNMLRAKDRSRDKKVILVIHDRVPEPDQDAGSRSIVQFMQTFVSMGMTVKFWPIDLVYDETYVAPLQALGIETFYARANQPEFERWYLANAANIDYVLLSRPTVVAEMLPILRRAGAPKILFYGHDIYHQRLAGQLELAPDNDAIRRDWQFYTALERQLWTEMDAIYYPAEREVEHVRHYLATLGRDIPVRAVPVYAYSTFPDMNERLDQRTTILLVAGFRHAPNVDGAIWFVQSILPRVIAALPGTHLVLVGSNPPPAITGLASSSITVTGFVSEEQLAERYARARVAIAPLRFGAGVKGKIVESLYFAVPMVTTSVGAQGFEQHADALSVSDVETEFADMVLELLRDDALWQQRSHAARKAALSDFSSAALSTILKRDIAL